MIVKKKSILLIAVAAMMLGLMGWTLTKQFSNETAATPAGTGSGAADGASTSSNTDAAVSQSGPGVSPTDPNSVFAKPADPAEEEREHKRIVADFERKFNAEPVDAAWAGKAEPTLEKIVTSDGIVMSGIEPDAYRSDCRSDTCRISAKFKNQLDADAWASMYTTMTGETFHETRHMVIPQPDGTFELRIYGYRLR